MIFFLGQNIFNPNVHGATNNRITEKNDPSLHDQTHNAFPGKQNHINNKNKHKIIRISFPKFIFEDISPEDNTLLRTKGERKNDKAKNIIIIVNIKPKAIINIICI